MRKIEPKYKNPTEDELRTIVAFWKAKGEYAPVREILKTFKIGYSSIYDFEVKR